MSAKCRYLCREKDRDTYRFERRLKPHEQGTFGGAKFVRGKRFRAESEYAAERHPLFTAKRDDVEAALGVGADVAEQGGWGRVTALAALRPALEYAGTLPARDLLAPSPYPVGSKPYAATATVESRVRLRQEVAAEFAAQRAVVERAHITVLKAAPTTENSVSNLLNGWIEQQKRQAKAKGREWDGRKSDRQTALNRFVACVGNLDWRDVTRKHAMLFREALAGDAPWTQEMSIRHVSAVFKVAIDNEVADVRRVNPFYKITPVVAPAESDGGKPYTPAHMTALRKAAEASPVWAEKNRGAGLMGFMVTAYTGFRISESTDLCKGDVVRKDGRVLVYPQRHKTKASKRFTVLPKAFGDTFYAWAQASATEELFAYIKPSTDKKTRTWWFSERFPLLRKAAGTPTDRSMYEFRDTIASRLESNIGKGLGQRITDFITGHEPEGVKGKHYLAFDVAEVAEALDSIKVFSDDTA